jgi:hypothetical protein
MHRPAAPVVAIIVLSLGSVVALWATTSGSSSEGNGPATQKSARKAASKGGQKATDVRIPRWMLADDDEPGDGKKGDKKDGANDGGTGKETSTEKSRTPQPPRWLSNPEVPDDISWNHRDAVTDAEIAAKGWTNLSEGQQAWVIRRTRAKVIAYRAALIAAHERFIARIWPAAIAVNGQRRFVALDRDLIAAAAALDGKLAASYEAVDGAINVVKAFLEEANNTWLERDPVRLPKFEERSNPAWREWDRRGGDDAHHP